MNYQPSAAEWLESIKTNNPSFENNKAFLALGKNRLNECSHFIHLHSLTRDGLIQRQTNNINMSKIAISKNWHELINMNLNFIWKVYSIVMESATQSPWPTLSASFFLAFVYVGSLYVWRSGTYLRMTYWKLIIIFFTTKCGLVVSKLDW